MRIIGFAGKAGSGKDTAALALIHQGWYKYSFAQPIRDGLEAMFGIPQSDMFDTQLKNQPDYKYGRSIRYLLQTCGTEFGRNMVDEDVWIKRGMEICSSYERVVIADVRYENEAMAIRNAGGIIIEVIRHDPEYEKLVETGGVVAHSSEACLPRELIDVVFDNNSTIDSLWKRVLEVVNNHYAYQK
jgi:hypothetical protein